MSRGESVCGVPACAARSLSSGAGCRLTRCAPPQFDLLEAPPIVQLGEDEATAPLLRLLRLVIAGDVKVCFLVSLPAVPAFVLDPPCCASCRAGLCMLALPRLRRASRLRDGWRLDDLERCAAQALEAFRAEHGAVLEARGLAVDDVLAKTRIMALLVLGTRREEISFATIQVRPRRCAAPGRGQAGLGCVAGGYG